MRPAAFQRFAGLAAVTAALSFAGCDSREPEAASAGARSAAAESASSPAASADEAGRRRRPVRPLLPADFRTAFVFQPGGSPAVAPLSDAVLAVMADRLGAVLDVLGADPGTVNWLTVLETPPREGPSSSELSLVVNVRHDAARLASAATETATHDGVRVYSARADLLQGLPFGAPCLASLDGTLLLISESADGIRRLVALYRDGTGAEGPGVETEPTCRLSFTIADVADLKLTRLCSDDGDLMMLERYVPEADLVVRRLGRFSCRLEAAGDKASVVVTLRSRSISVAQKLSDRLLDFRREILAQCRDVASPEADRLAAVLEAAVVCVYGDVIVCELPMTAETVGTLLETARKRPAPEAGAPGT